MAYICLNKTEKNEAIFAVKYGGLYSFKKVILNIRGKKAKSNKRNINNNVASWEVVWGIILKMNICSMKYEIFNYKYDLMLT